MKFACLTINYAQLPEQLKNSKISIFNNNWNNIHDFTPVSGEKNWSFFNEVKLKLNLINMKILVVFLKNIELTDYLALPDKFTCNQLKLSFSKEQSFIPLTVGTINRSNNESVLVVFFSSDPTENGWEMQDSQASRLFNEIRAKHPHILLIQSKKYDLSDLSAENVFKTKNFNHFLKNGPIIGLEFNGYECSKLCLDLVNELKLKPSKFKFKLKNI